MIGFCIPFGNDLMFSNLPYATLASVGQVFIKCYKIGLLVGRRMFVNSSEETVHCVSSFRLVSSP